MRVKALAIALIYASDDEDARERERESRTTTAETRYPKLGQCTCSNEVGFIIMCEVVQISQQMVYMQLWVPEWKYSKVTPKRILLSCKASLSVAIICKKCCLFYM